MASIDSFDNAYIIYAKFVTDTEYNLRFTVKLLLQDIYIKFTSQEY